MFVRTTARHRAWGSGAGFTLVELVITVAVASVLLAMAVPSFNQMIISSRLTAQSNDMLAAINLARSEAIKRNARMPIRRRAPVGQVSGKTGSFAPTRAPFCGRAR
jgi:type IV fimbrial biogenesis protein FimT